MTATSTTIDYAPQAPTLGAVAPGYKPRPAWQPFAMIVPVVPAGMAMMSGSAPALTDLSFVLLTILCGGFLVEEFINFPRRFGIGGLVLFGGVLTWFCYDYMTNWFGFDYASTDRGFKADLIARVAFLHMLFICLMSFGLHIKSGRWLEKLFMSIPEPPDKGFYFKLILFMFFLGMVPYLFFSYDWFWDALWKDMWAGRTGQGARWMVGRSGLINFNWGGYVAEFLNVGQVGAQLGLFYAVFVTKSRIQQAVCWSYWGLWMMLSFGSGTRGMVAFNGLPALAIVFIYYQNLVAMKMKKFGFLPFIVGGLLLYGILVMVQIQATFRTISFANVDFNQVNVLELKGNSMFSEGLAGYALVPSQVGFIQSNSLLESIVRPLPEAVFYFLVHPIPRALWHNKPIDPLWAWYNKLTTGASIYGGTTASKGMVGWWYMRWGTPGLIQGGFFMGWLMIICERVLQQARGRTMTILVSMMFATWLFRCYRDVGYLEIWSFMVSVVLLWVLMRGYRMVFAPAAQ